MDVALALVALVATVAVVAGLTRRFGGSPPLVLLVVGVLASYVPGVPTVELDPELVLVGLLPPLLYAAAIRTSLVDFRANRDAIALLSVGAVAVTTVAVGLVAWWVVPGVSLAAALALGAVVAPPDAVAATAVARQVGMPRRLVSILEGESLVNDATALVALGTAVAALGGAVTAGQVAVDFLLAAGGGVVVGLLVAMLLAAVRRRVEDPVLDTTLSFVAPFVAYLPAETVHASGVLAVVVTGLVLGHKSPVLQTARSRLAERTNWATVQFLLENAVFVLIGLQLRGILAGLADSRLGWAQIVLACLAVLVATVVVRIGYVLACAAAYRVGPPRVRARAWPWRTSLIASWAGLRGVVTLAAAFVLPPDTPERSLLVLAAFTVVAGTLLGQGLTLPALVRRLGLRGPDAAEDALQEASLVSEAVHAGMERLDELATSDEPVEVLEQLRERASRRGNAVWEQLGRPQDDMETPSAVYRRLRLAMLDAERGVLLQARDSGRYDDEVLRRAMTTLDVEESLLDPVADVVPAAERELVAAERDVQAACAHLRAAPYEATPDTPGVCGDCLREGTTWVHLRECLACGHVACCDSSPRRHSRLHYGAARHPVMRSVEPGEAWRWCWVDEQLG